MNSTHFEFRNTLRGFLEIDAGPAIIQRHFQFNVKCVYAMTSELVSRQLKVLNLTRRYSGVFGDFVYHILKNLGFNKYWRFNWNMYSQLTEPVAALYSSYSESFVSYRNIEYDDSIIKTGYLETGLWGDRNAETKIRMPVPYAENLYISFRYVSESIRKPKIHIRRCWATPTKNADSQKSRDIYRDR